MECVFCEIIKGTIKANIVASNANAIAFLDATPVSDGHVLVIPKQHYRDLSSCPIDVLNDVMKLVSEVTHIISDSKLRPWGFNFVSNEGKIAGQQVMHFHMHIIPKYSKNEGYEAKFGNRFTGEVQETYAIIMKTKENGKYDK
ncbi:MAG: HIT domain-containing protein [Mycoplasmataceae bacterium]|nr:HIT domain-containing protein [Mycoplasmataceae bacterium]